MRVRFFVRADRIDTLGNSRRIELTTQIDADDVWAGRLGGEKIAILTMPSDQEGQVNLIETRLIDMPTTRFTLRNSRFR